MRAVRDAAGPGAGWTALADLIGSAPGKLLLFGEHAAVYGEPALGISLPWTAALRITPLSAAQCASCEWLPPLPAALAAMLAELPPAAEIEVRSRIPIGLGFGSSAALCVAAERALAAARRAEPSAGAIWRGAHEREKVFHGTPSGADTGLAAHPGVGFLSWPGADGGDGGLPRYESLPATELHLVVAAVPRRGDTRAQVAAVARRLRAGDDAAEEALRRLGRCSREARALLLQPRMPATALGALADAAHRLLAALGLADPRQDRLLQAGRAGGACGGKLSGAGCGGACYLVCRDAASAIRVLEAIRNQATVAGYVVAAGGNTRLASPESRPVSVSRWLYRGGR